MNARLTKGLKIRLIVQVTQEPEDVAAGVEPERYGFQMELPPKASFVQMERELAEMLGATLDATEKRGLFAEQLLVS